MALAVVLATACGSADDWPGAKRSAGGEASIRARVDTLGGIEHVFVSGELAPFAVREIVRFGGEGGPDHETFAFVSSVSLDSAGLVYVADLRRHRVTVHDTLGRLHRIIGRQGEGPGEFESLFSAVPYRGDLAVLDVGNARVGLIAADDTWRGQYPAMGSLSASPKTLRLYLVGPGEMYQWGHDVVDDITHPVWWPYEAGQREAAVARPTLPPPEGEIPARVVCTLGRGFSWFDHPLAPRSLSHPAPGGATHLATSDRYRVLTLSPQGDTVRILDRETPPVPLAEADWVSVHARFEQWLADKEGASCTPGELDRPARRPAIEALVVDPAGQLWMERAVQGGTVWEGFDASGRLVASFTGFDYDREWTTPWIAGGLVAWVSTDALDVPTVHVGRIRAGTDP